MIPRGKSPRFLTRLKAPPDPAERRRTERVLASARVFLACAGLLAIYLDPTEPSRYSALAYSLLGGYLLYSLLVWVLLHRRDVYPSFPGMHALDLCFPALFTLFTDGPGSPFFLFFVFALTAAAFRWGFLETMATSMTISLLIIVEASLLSHGAHIGHWVQGQFELNRFVIRLSYLLILGVLLGYLGEEQKQLHAENAAVNRVMSKARIDVGLRGTLQALMGELMDLFGAPRALAVLHQTTSGRIFLWRSTMPANGENSISTAEVLPEERAPYVAAIPAHSFYCERRGSASSWGIWALDADGSRTRVDPSQSFPSCPEMQDATSLLCVSFTMGEEWTGRLFLFDGAAGFDKLKELRFAQNLLRQVGPAVYTIYLLRRLRSRAGAIERARVARELHDGAIQALIAVEMEVDVARRQMARSNSDGAASSQMERIQEMLREQVFDLRMLMQQLRPLDMSPGQFLDYLADTVDRFRRDTGIDARFVCGVEEVEFSGRTCRELTRIVQEALVNVRKHSGASKVLVRFGSHEGKWLLTIEDDGRGFAFKGKMSLSDMDAARQGPGIIKERVRMLGGDMSIESHPGRGSHLEISLPLKAQVAYV